MSGGDAAGGEGARVGDAAASHSLQMTMFTPLSQKIVDRLAAVDVDGLTPREALNLLAELQRELGRDCEQFKKQIPYGNDKQNVVGE